MVFSDLDVLMVGHIVPQMSQAFDQYWNHKLAFPITDLVKKPETSALNQVFTPKTQKADKPASQQLDPVLKLKNDYLKRLRGNRLCQPNQTTKIAALLGKRAAIDGQS